MFYHLTPNVLGEGSSDGRLTNVISVPVLDLNKSQYVEVGTAAVVLLGFLWIVWCLFGVWRKAGYGSRKEQVVIEKKRK